MVLLAKLDSYLQDYSASARFCTLSLSVCGLFVVTLLKRELCVQVRGGGDWISTVDPASGKAYYANKVTGKVQWHRPTD
jgi:hypothetical protein